MPVHWMDLGTADRFVLRGPEGALENEYSQMYITFQISYMIYFKKYIYIYSIFKIFNIHILCFFILFDTLYLVYLIYG